MSKWINVKDRLPKEGIDLEEQYDDVLILFKRVCNHCCSIGEKLFPAIGYCDTNERWHLTELLDNDYLPNNYHDQIEIIYWMTLSPIPTK
jgi:hypothetical protein